MDLFLLIIRLVLAGLFATAGFAKFADLKGSEKAFKEFGIPERLALPSSVALSIFEIVIAILFIFPATSWHAAIAAASLLALFIVQMTYQRVKGNAPDCHCFGQLHSEPVGIKSIVRNVLFLALAVIPLSRGVDRQGLSLEQVTADMVPTLISTLAVIMLAGSLLYLRRIVASQEELRRRMDVLEVVARDGSASDHEHITDPSMGLPIGSPLPSFELRSFDGDIVTRETLLRHGSPLLFIFVSPTCEPCQALMPDVLKWRDELRSKLQMVFVTTGDEDENLKKFQQLGRSQLLIDDERRFSLSVGGRWTPTAFLVGAEGKIASHVAAGDIEIEELIEKIQSSDISAPFIHFTNGKHHGKGVKIGVEAPDFTFKTIDGREIRKRDLIGKRTLIAFWSPTCPHCSAFLEEFKNWESVRHNGDPDAIVVSSGDEEQHKSFGFTSPVVIDRGYRTAAKLGMFGTPSAVLIDENGVIASETAVGRDNIWALLGRSNETG